MQETYATLLASENATCRGFAENEPTLNSGGVSASRAAQLRSAPSCV